NVRTDGKLAHAIAVFVGMGVTPEILLQFVVRGMGVGQAITFDVNVQRILPQAAKLRAQPVAYDPVDHKASVDFAWSGKHFAAGQVTPFIRTDYPAGLEPAIIRTQVGGKIRSGGSLGPHLFRT